MSGHSKWSTIKRKKGANDAARGKIFTRLAREIQVAARGGADPNSNMTLRLAVDRARAENMPKDNIDRAIRRGAGLEKDAAEIEEVTYEGYGPNGIAIIVQCLTDNRNRAISEVRRCFIPPTAVWASQIPLLGNSPRMATWALTLWTKTAKARRSILTNSLWLRWKPVRWMSKSAMSMVEVYTERNELAQVAQTLNDAGFSPDESRLMLRPNTTVTLEGDQGASVLNLIEALEESDDVSNVYHNLELTDEMVAQFA